MISIDHGEGGYPVIAKHKPLRAFENRSNRTLMNETAAVLFQSGRFDSPSMVKVVSA